jgi:hypothetical protein
MASMLVDKTTGAVKENYFGEVEKLKLDEYKKAK